MSIRPVSWFAIALMLGAGPVLAQTAAPAPKAAATAPKDDLSAVPPPPEDDLPRGAPRDDYQFVGWCEGALATHMQLYVKVKPDLDAISQRWNTVDEDAKDYSDQQVAGRQDLALFESAMRAAEAASPTNLVPSGQDAIDSGVAMWKDLGTVDARNQAYSWMNWELPERCMRVANDLKSRSLLLAPLLRNNSTVAVAPAGTEIPAPRIPASRGDGAAGRGAPAR